VLGIISVTRDPTILYQEHSMTRTSVALMTLSALILTLPLTASKPASYGAPWMSLEMPANPLDPATRGAALVVRTYRHSRPEAVPLTGTAEGVVDGVRQSVPLHFKATGQPGVFAVNQSWPNEGAWVLAISTGEKLHLLVELGPNGGIMPTSYFGQSSADLSLRSVRVVTGNLPERDIDKSLTTLAMQ
jgi:hypothetical protein